MNPQREPNPTKAIIYCRVSSLSQQKEGDGLHSQEVRCRQHAAAKGLEVAAVFPDTISGGGDFMKRPGMVALLSFIDAQPDERFVVIFDDLKRFARDREFHFRLKEAFTRRNTAIDCLNYRFDDTPEGEFVETIFAAQGQLERKQHGRQVAQKMKARMENGYWVHTAPIGYRYEKAEGRGRMLVAAPPFDGIVREAFEGYASGRFQTEAEVVRFCESFPEFPRNKNGEVRQERVREMLTNPLYTGHICSQTYGIHWLKGKHEPIISLELFDKVQKRREAKAHAPQRKNIGDAFALRGVVVCACCDAPLRSSFSRGRHGGLYPYYLCQTKGCEAYGKSNRRDEVEGQVGAIIKQLQPTETLFKLATAMFKKAWAARHEQAQEIIRTGKRQIASLDKEIDAIVERILGTQNTRVISRYEERISDLEKQKALLGEKLANQATPKGTWDEKLEPVLTFLANPYKLWESGDITLRRMVLKLAFAGQIQYCRNEGARTPKMALPFKALGALETMQVTSGGTG